MNRVSTALFVCGMGLLSATLSAHAATVRIAGGAWCSGSHLVATNVMVGSSARLCGTPTVAGAVDVQGVLSPGWTSNEVATLSVSGSLAFAQGSFECYAVSTTSLDLIDVTGAVSGVATVQFSRATGVVPIEQVMIQGDSSSDYSNFSVVPSEGWQLGQSGSLDLWIGGIPTLLVLGTNGEALVTNGAPTLDSGTDFGHYLAGQQPVHSLTLTNAGVVTLNIDSWTTNGPNADLFSVSALSSNLAVGEAQEFDVQFSPLALGSYSASLSIVSDDPESPYVVNLRGSCYASSTNVGPYSGGNIVTLTNGQLGNGIDITNVMVGGSAATITGQGSNWVSIAMPAGSGASDILVQSTTEGDSIMTGAYTYNPPGRLDVVTPGTGLWTGGYDVVLSGTNFCNGSMNDLRSVTLADTTATVQTVYGSTQIVVTANATTNAVLGDVMIDSISYGLTTKSNSFEYLKSDQDITFGAIAAKTYGDPAFDPSAIASSGLTVDYTTSDSAVATNAGSLIYMAGVGTCDVVAVQSGNGVYNPAVNVTNTLVVAPKSLIVTGAVAETKGYDGTTAATITGGALVGVVSGDTVTLANNTTGTFAQAEVGVNIAVTSYMTLAGGDADSYTVSQPALEADIIKADQTIDFPVFPDPEETETVSVSATASSGLPVTFAVESGPATLSGATNLSFSTTGVVSVVASQAGNAHWNEAAVTNTFNVTSSKVLSIPVSTYLGGSGSETGRGIAVDESGNTYVLSYTSSTNFPVTNAFQSTIGNPGHYYFDVSLTKFAPDGSNVIYSTYLGGTYYDYAYAIAVHTDETVYVAGYTQSTNFPVANAYQSSYNNNRDGFVSRFSADGSSLIYSTYFGGSHDDRIYGLDVGPDGSAYITGWTQSDDFPLVNAIQTNRTSYESFVTRFSPEGHVIFSTFLGGSSVDYGYAIRVDSNGTAFITGTTQSSDFPVTNAYQAALAGIVDAYVTCISADGSTLLYSTYLGGSDSGDSGYAIDVDKDSKAYIAGYTESTDFPVTNAYQSSRAGDDDAFVAVLSASGSNLLYGTFLGGSAEDDAYGIAVDDYGNVFVAGRTFSDNFPTKRAVQTSRAGDADAFLTRLQTRGTNLLCSTYLGGSDTDYGYALVVDTNGAACVAGYTESEDFPTANAFQPVYGGGSRDIFVSRFDFLPTPPEMLVLGTNGAAVAHDEPATLATGTDFGGVLAGSLVTNTFSITNGSWSVLHIQDVSTNGAGASAFQFGMLPSKIVAGSVSNFTVVFDAATYGSYAATLSINNGSTTTPYAVNFAGSSYGVSTNVGPYAGGNTLTITNGNFGTITNVLVGGIPATIDSSGANWVTITLPPATSPGIKDIVVQTSDDGDKLLHDAYTFHPAGIIEGVSPTSGSWSGEYSVVISGTNMCSGWVDDITSVSLAGVTGVLQGFIGSTQVTVWAMASAGAVVSGDVVVVSTEFGTTILSNAFTYLEAQAGLVGTHGEAIASGAPAEVANGTDFGQLMVGMGEAVTNTFSITNSGNTALLISGVTTSGVGAASFTSVDIPSSVSVGTVSNFTVVFEPVSGGTLDAALNLANNGTNGTYVMNMTAFGLDGGIGLASDTLTFNGTFGGSDPAVQTLVMTNFGMSSFTYTNVLSYGGESGWLTTAPDNGTLTSSNSMLLTNSISLSGINVGTHSCTVSVTAANATNSPQDYVVTLHVAKSDQTITFPSPGPQLTTNLVGLSASAASGLPVTCRVVSGSASISGYTNLSFTASGNVVLEAQQAGNSNWNAAVSVGHTITVSKATASITFSNLTQTYDGTQKSPSHLTSPSGLTVGLTYDGSSTTPSNAGTYAVTGTVVDVMYQGVETASFTIEKADQGITFPPIPTQSYSNSYGVSASSTSGLAVAFSVASGPAQLTGDTNLSFTATGVVAVVAAQTGNANWNVAPSVTNSFLVTKANQLITYTNLADQITTNITPVSGSAQSGLTVEFEVLSGPAVLATNTSPTTLSYTNEGPVVLAIRQPGNAYWNAAPELTNSFLVTKAMASVSFTNLTQTYDGTALSPDASTMPTGLTLALTFDGLTNLPVHVGTYAVTGTVQDAMWRGSNTASFVIEQAAQEITFPAISDAAITSMVHLAASGGGTSNAVTFAVLSGPAEIGGSTNVKFKNIGVVSISANQLGNSNYLAAPTVTNTFTVFAVAPQISGPYASNVLAHTAVFGATVNSSNGAPVIERGAAWGTSPAFTNAVATHSEFGTWGAGPFTLNVTGLVAGVTNYFRLYAVNSAGTNWTAEASLLAIPDAPDIQAASGIVADGFTANWLAAVGATNYWLDVSPTNDFSSYVVGYSNLLVGDVTSHNVTGLASRPFYYIRVRSQNLAGISTNPSAFEVGMMLPVVILGFPDEHGAPYPLNYGTNLVLVGTVVTNMVPTPADELNGTRYVCTGFVGSGNAPLFGYTNTVSFTLTEDTTVTWQWRTEHYLDLTATNGGITNAVSGWKPEGWMYSLYPTNSPNCLFHHWVTNETVSGTDNPFVITMDTPMDVMAIFEEQRSQVSDQLQDWHLDPQYGWYTADLELCNSTNSTLPVVPPYWYVVPDSGKSGLLFPDGTDTESGNPYQDLTADMTAALATVGNGDANLDPGECVTVEDIIFYSTDRSVPTGTFVAAIASVHQPDPEYVPDTDGDGLPDAYERTQDGFNEHNPEDGAGDTDDDGMSAGEEYNADTDPSDPESYLAVTAIEQGQVWSKGGLIVTQYLERSPNLEAWTVIDTNYPPTTTTNMWPVVEDEVKYFYRVSVPYRQ